MANTLEQAVRNGIDIERAAERFYRLLAESTEETEARRFLMKMADQEADHAKRIEALGDRLGAEELPRYSAPATDGVETSPEWAFVEGISYPDALQLALQNEEHAAMFYEALADGAEGTVRELFIQLTRAEEHHIEALRSRLERLR